MKGCDMDVAKATEIVVIMLSPTIAVSAAIYVPKGVRAVYRRVRRSDLSPLPDYRPIEQVAGDLRRLLRQHESVRRSAGIARRAQHLEALEAAIADCAVEAARALDVPCPDRPVRGALPTPQLRRLLLALADAGLVLPPAVGLLAADRRL
jgi:hypothetical protein